MIQITSGSPRERVDPRRQRRAGAGGRRWARRGASEGRAQADGEGPDPRVGGADLRFLAERDVALRAQHQRLGFGLETPRLERMLRIKCAKVNAHSTGWFPRMSYGS